MSENRRGGIFLTHTVVAFCQLFVINEYITIIIGHVTRSRWFPIGGPSYNQPSSSQSCSDIKL